MKLYTYHRNLKGYQINMGTNKYRYVNKNLIKYLSKVMRMSGNYVMMKHVIYSVKIE